ncbi:putative protease inhibitor [Mariannaea sp. PMI_226]|nr:putative protease inhibitor [Mariannaea sp. PMI_226]
MPTNQNVQQGLELIEADPSKVLGLTVGSHSDIKPGQFIPRADATPEPELSFSGLSPSKTYMVVSLDPDAPFPSFSVLGPALHWIQPGLQVGADNSTSLKATAPFVADYVGPGPPPGSSPHRYIFLLYEEPAGFDGKKFAPANGQKMGIKGRIRYDLDAWAKQVSLGPVLACNYFKSN